MINDLKIIKDNYIYLDSNSYSKVLPKVREMVINFIDHPLNPSSIHYLGQQANGFVEDTRDCLKKYLNCKNDYDVIFTSGGSEANNLAIERANFGDFDLHICSAAEHKSVLYPIQNKRNFLIASVDSCGNIDLEKLIEILKNNQNKKIFLSIIYVNNETGVINNLSEIVKHVRLVHDNVVIHSDIAQGLGKLRDLNDLDFQKLDIDLATVIGYKFGAMVGAGALIYRKTIAMKPMILGGSQEYNLRAGTENVMAIYSMKVALNEIYEEKIDCEENLIKYFEGKLKEIVSPKDLTIFSENGQRIWNTSYFAISGLDAKTQLMFYNSNKVYVGTGSACSAGLDEDSYVLSAMGFDEQIRKCAVRVSLSVVSKKKDIDILLEKLQQLYERFK